jgi:hypothetical protein
MYLEMNLMKDTKDFLNENYKSLIREIKEDTGRWKDLYAHGSVESTL